MQLPKIFVNHQCFQDSKLSVSKGFLEQHQIVNDEIINQQQGHLISELVIALDLVKFNIIITFPKKHSIIRQKKMGEKNIQKAQHSGQKLKLLFWLWVCQTHQKLEYYASGTELQKTNEYVSLFNFFRTKTC